MLSTATRRSRVKLMDLQFYYDDEAMEVEITASGRRIERTPWSVELNDVEVATMTEVVNYNKFGHPTTTWILTSPAELVTGEERLRKVSCINGLVEHLNRAAAETAAA